MARIDWAGIAALVLALGLALGFVAAIAGWARPTPEAVQLLNLAAGGMLAIVAGYVARADIRRGPRPGVGGNPPPTDPPEGIRTPP